MLDSLFNPGSIAVIGASRDPKKVGHAVLNNLIRFQYKGELYPVNPSSHEILGLKSYPVVSEIRKEIDLAVIVVPARSVPDTLIDCVRAGVRQAVILSAGFREAGPEGVRLEQEVKKIAGDNGIRILGPNCLGIINTANNMNATFAAGMLPKGRIAFFSQSGALGIAILDWAIGNKIGFSKFISLGNKTDLNETDFIDYFINDTETDVILGYIEDVVEGKRFLDSARKATKAKPIILLKSGGTEAGARAASSHTGALAGSDNAFRAAFMQTGIIQAQGLQDLFEAALALSGGKLPSGDRLLIVTNAGGPGIIAADAAERLGLKLSQMSKKSIETIAGRLPPNASLFNPVDIIGDATSERYALVLQEAVQDPFVDGIIVILTPQAMINIEDTTEILIRASRATAKPILSSFMGDMSVRESVGRLRANSIPDFFYPETAVKAFKRLSDYSAWKKLDVEQEHECSSGGEAVKKAVDNFLGEKKFSLGEGDARTVLSGYGFRFPGRALALTAKEASLRASELGFPVVMKVSSPDILHKTDVGGVKLNINSKKEAEDAFIEITSNVKRLMPEAFISGVAVYETVTAGREVILGVTLDRTFGHMIMFGLGGVYVEVLKDVSFRIAPLSRCDALSMVSEIKAAPVLKGVRGEKPVDIDAIIDGILRLSCIVTDFPVIHELDINPFMVMEEGAVAIDARIVFERPEKF